MKLNKWTALLIAGFFSFSVFAETVSTLGNSMKNDRYRQSHFNGKPKNNPHFNGNPKPRINTHGEQIIRHGIQPNNFQK